MKTLHIVTTIAAICGSCMGLSAQSFNERDVVYLYDSATPGYLGLEEDCLYSNICKALPEDYQLVPVEMCQIDEEGLNTLASSKLIVVSDTGNDRTADDPVVKRLGELVDYVPMLCFNADFTNLWTFGYGNNETKSFQIEREIVDPHIRITDSEQQYALFDDVLSAADGSTSLYLPGTKTWVNAAVNSFAMFIVGCQTFAHVDMPDSDASPHGIMLRSPSENFFFLGLAQPLMSNLSAAGKNLIRNAVKYMLDKEIFSQKPHLSWVMANDKPVSADFMAELSSGRAHLDVEYDTYKFIYLSMETTSHDCLYTSRWHIDYSAQQAYIEYWYDDKYDVYTIDYDFAEPGSSASSSGSDTATISNISDDTPKSQTAKFDLQGRPTSHSCGLIIENDRVVLKR